VQSKEVDETETAISQALFWLLFVTVCTYVCTRQKFGSNKPMSWMLHACMIIVLTVMTGLALGHTTVTSKQYDTVYIHT
jgi:TRAP-type C4-dicarboxylate transport system permease small subunit